LNTDFTRFLNATWHLLTDVPGWADPSLKLRLRRLVPIIVPVVASAVLFGWLTFVRQPQMDRTRDDYAYLIEIEEEIDQLRIACSEDQAEELAGQAETASGFLLPEPEAAESALDTIRDTASRHQWVGAFKDYQPASDALQDDDAILFIPAMGRMKPERGNRKPFASLLALLAELNAIDLRMDLTRLSVRVDEANGTVADINFRIASHHSHEKAPQ
jgi:hypothetical protein